MENYSYQNVNKNENELNFAEVWSVIRRRKKFMSTIFFSTLGVILFFTAYQRTFNPVFLGKFTLLINDPLNKKNSSSVSDGIIENLARNTTDNDIPTLMELLKSPYLTTIHLYHIDRSKKAQHPDCPVGTARKTASYLFA